MQQYADLKTQSAEFDPDELQDARLDLRPAMERSVVDRVQSAYGDKYDYLMMYDSKRDVADILHEETEARSIREHLRQKQQAQQRHLGTIIYICYHILALTSIPTIDIEPHKFKGARSWLTVLL